MTIVSSSDWDLLSQNPDIIIEILNKHEEEPLNNDPGDSILIFGKVCSRKLLLENPVITTEIIKKTF